MKAFSWLGTLALASLMVVGCGSSSTASNDTGGTTGGNSVDKPLVFFAQANSADPWRQVFDKDTKAAAVAHQATFTYETQQADDDASKQIGQIETAMIKKPKVLMVSPATEAVQSAIEKAHDVGAFVILLDRSVPGDKWDVQVGGDNNAIGHAAAQYMAKEMGDKGTILMIRGIADATATKDRAGGFMAEMKNHPGITVMEGDDCGYQRQKAQTYMENFLQSGKPFDAVYAHNDEMAIGAILAMDAAKTPHKLVVGIDGCQQEVVQMIKDGKMAATFSYPQPGPKGIEIANDFITAGKKPAAKKVVLQTEMVTKDTADQYLSGHPNLAK